MPWGAVVGAVIGGGASIIGSRQAGKRQARAAERAAQAQLQMFERIRGDLAPYRELGGDVLGALRNLSGAGEGGTAGILGALERLPGYQFAREQGMLATQNLFGPRGLSLSGAAGKGLAEFGTGLAEQTFGSQFNRLLGVANLGQQAATQTGAFGTSAAQAAAGPMMGVGGAEAAGILGGTNAFANLADYLGRLYTAQQMGLFANQRQAPAVPQDMTGIFTQPYQSPVVGAPVPFGG